MGKRNKNWTEGEWWVKDRTTNGVHGYEICWSPDEECVTDHVYTLADANLMAASKHLVEALEVLLEVAKRVPGYSNQCDKAREALVMAYGESEQ